MQLIPLVIGAGIALASGYLQRKKAGKGQDPFHDDSPTSVSTRGSFIPYVIGHARVGATFTWVGNREARQEVTGRTGGKGSKKKKTYQTVYYEEGMHCLCVGPVTLLHKILANGQEVFTGPIGPSTHPSGSSIETSLGTLEVYWGEDDQPINTYLGDPGQNPSNMGVQSRWPLVCYVVWRNIRLGTSPTWPSITYEIETSIQVSGLSRSSTVLAAPGIPSGTPFPIIGTFSLDFNYLLADYRAAEVPPGSFVLLEGNSGAPDGTYFVFTSENIVVNNAARTEVALRGLVGQTSNPQVPVSGDGQITLISNVSGINPAHAIYQVLFAPFPYGMGLDPDEFDIESLENLGVSCQNEGLRSSFTIYDGQNYLTLISAIMQDLGLVIPLDVNSGLYKFQLVRPPTAVVPLIPQNMIVQFPEFETIHKPQPLNRIMFTYRDFDRSFREMTITLDDDGEARLEEQQKAGKVSIVTALDYPTAARIAERRSQEEFANSSVIRLVLDRAARKLIPGRIFEVEGIADQLIVLTTEIDPESGQIRVEAIPNYYATQEVTAVTDVSSGGAATVSTKPGPDLVLNFFEVPALVLNGEPPTVLVPRVRGSTAVIGAQIHISRDNATYQFEVNQDVASPGGLLLDVMAVDDPFVIEIGPTFQAKGPDIGSALDLTGDDVNWRAGRQKGLIGDELFFIRNVEALGGDTYRLRGIIRARYDTVREAHAVGAGVILFQDADMEPIQDPLLEPGFQLFVKAQPVSTTAFPLDTLNPVSKTLQGKGIVPMDPVNLRVKLAFGYSPTYFNGSGGVQLEWSHRSGAIPSTGAGLQSAGAPVGTSPIEGDFTIEIYGFGGGGAALGTISGIVATTYFLTSAFINALFNPFNIYTSFHAKVKNVNGGFESNSIGLDVGLEN